MPEVGKLFNEKGIYRAVWSIERAKLRVLPILDHAYPRMIDTKVINDIRGCFMECSMAALELQSALDEILQTKRSLGEFLDAQRAETPVQHETEKS